MSKNKYYYIKQKDLYAILPNIYKNKLSNIVKDINNKNLSKSKKIHIYLGFCKLKYHIKEKYNILTFLVYSTGDPYNPRYIKNIYDFILSL